MLIRTRTGQIEHYRAIVKFILTMIKFRVAAHCLHDWKVRPHAPRSHPMHPVQAPAPSSRANKPRPSRWKGKSYFVLPVVHYHRVLLSAQVNCNIVKGNEHTFFHACKVDPHAPCTTCTMHHLHHASHAPCTTPIDPLIVLPPCPIASMLYDHP